MSEFFWLQKNGDYVPIYTKKLYSDVIGYDNDRGLHLITYLVYTKSSPKGYLVAKIVNEKEIVEKDTIILMLEARVHDISSELEKVKKGL